MSLQAVLPSLILSLLAAFFSADPKLAKYKKLMAFIPSLWRTHQKHTYVSTMSVPRCIWLCHSLSVWPLVVLAKDCSVQCAIVVREVLIAEACDATGETTYTRFWDVLSIHHIMYIEMHSFCIHVLHSCAFIRMRRFVAVTVRFRCRNSSFPFRVWARTVSSSTQFLPAIACLAKASWS